VGAYIELMRRATAMLRTSSDSTVCRWKDTSTDAW
jgi:hypothetical protein